MLWSERELDLDRDKEKARQLKQEVLRVKEEHVSSLRETLYELEDEVENLYVCTCRCAYVCVLCYSISVVWCVYIHTASYYVTRVPMVR